MKDNKSSIIVPAYNEERAIEEVLDSIKEAMNKTKWDYEIIVVDDSSQDRTAEIAKGKGAKVIQHVENKGVGAARKTGIKKAKGKIIVMIDGDGTYSSKDIPRLLECMDTYDMVIGARKIETGSLSMLRRPAKFIIRKLAEYITRKKIPDLNSGLRAFKKEMALNFFNILPEGHSWVSTLTIASLSNGYDVKYIPIDYYKRKGISTFHPLKDTVNYFFLIFRTIMYFKPLKIFAPLAIIVFISGVARTIYDAKVLLHIKESDVIIVLTSILIGVLGLLADLIVKQRK